MKTESPQGVKRPRLWLLILSLCLAPAGIVGADSVELTNGDHYSGTVLSVSLSNVSLRSEIQGLIVLPREKVATIVFSPTTDKTNASPTTDSLERQVLALTVAPGTVAQLSSGNTSSNLVGQVQSQLLAAAGREATQKYNQMATDLLSGKLSIPELRRQAQETLKAVEQSKQDVGPEMDDLVGSYLSILRDFLQETTPP
jgi:hypothetical protein